MPPTPRTDPDPVPDVGTPTDAAIDTLTARQQDAIQSVETASAAMLDGLTRTQREIAGFVSERIRQDMDAQQAFLRCRSLDDVRDVQTRFFRTAMEQYAAETTRLLQLGGEMVGRTLERRHD